MNPVLTEVTSFSIMLESLAEAFIAIDLEGIIILYNERAADILGVPVKQALHHHIKDVFKNSYLYKVLKNERPELNKIQILLGKQVIGNHRIFYDKDGKRGPSLLSEVLIKRKSMPKK